MPLVPAARLTGLVSLALLALLAGCVVAPARHYQPPPPPPPPRTLPPPPPPAVSATAPASTMYFYPERGQDEARQDRDRYECYRWAVRETGVDPGMTPVRQTTAPMPPVAPMPPNAYPVLRDGAPVVAGAATGAVIGAVSSGPRHAGQGAVLGAIFGATLGAIAQEQHAQSAERAQARQEARQEAWQARQQAAAEASQRPLNDFRRAIGACMGGRGYKVG